jgi:hypothetical protein
MGDKSQNTFNKKKNFREPSLKAKEKRTVFYNLNHERGAKFIFCFVSLFVSKKMRNCSLE